MQTKRKIMIMAGILALLALWSCEKPAGPGGKATIKGRVYARDWDNTQRYEVSQGYSTGERVYICYGNSNIPGNDTRTGIDGTFEFRYLNEGHYKIFVNSLDTTVILKGNDTEIPIVKEVDITSPKQTVDVGDIRINK